MNIRHILVSLKKVRSVLWWGFAFASAVYVGIEIAKQWPECFPGASIAGSYFSNLAMAYIGGFIFWFVVDHWEKQESERESLSIAFELITNLKREFNQVISYLMGDFTTSPTHDHVATMTQADLIRVLDNCTIMRHPKGDLKPAEVVPKLVQGLLLASSKYYKSTEPFYERFKPSFILYLDGLRDSFTREAHSKEGASLEIGPYLEGYRMGIQTLTRAFGREFPDAQERAIDGLRVRDSSGKPGAR